MNLSRANGINSLELVTLEQAQSGLLEARTTYFDGAMLRLKGLGVMI